MEPDNNRNINKASQPQDIASARIRSESECSITSDEGSTMSSGKR